MEKISPPLRIALVAVMLLAVAWFLVLRPKPPADQPATPPPGIAGLSNDVKRAQSATATANAAATAAQNSAASVDAANGAGAATQNTNATKSDGASATADKATTESATVTGANGTTVTGTKKTTKAVAKTTPAKAKTKTPAGPKADADPAAPLVAALKRNKAVVLLFRNDSSDSQAVADAVRAVPGQVRRVVVRVAPVSQVGRYATFTEKTQISQAPTVIVIGPGRRAKVIVGYTSTAEVAEAVGDLRRAARR